MAKIRTLRGLAHDTLDHAVGPFGSLHPHVGEYATDQQLGEVFIDLLNEPALSTPAVPKPLQLASEALQQWFREHVVTYGFRVEDLAAARIKFGSFGSDPYIFGTTVMIETSTGRNFSHRRGWPPNAD